MSVWVPSLGQVRRRRRPSTLMEKLQVSADEILRVDLSLGSSTPAVRKGPTGQRSIALPKLAAPALNSVLLTVDVRAAQLAERLQIVIEQFGRAVSAGRHPVIMRVFGQDGMVEIVAEPVPPRRLGDATRAGAVRREKGRGKQKGDLRGVFRYIRIYWKPYLGMGVLILGCQLAYKVFQTVFALALKVIVDNALVASAQAVIVPLLVGLLLAFPVVAVFYVLGERLSARASAKLINDIRTAIYNHLQDLPIDYFKQAHLGDIVARFSTDMHVVERGVALRFIPGVVTTASILINVPFLLVMSPILGVGTLASLPVIYYLVEWVTPRAAESNYLFKISEAQMIDVVQENARAQPMIRSFGVQRLMADRFQQQLTKVEDSNTEANFDRALVENTTTMSLLLVQLLATSGGALLVFNGAMTIGSLVAFNAMLAVVANDLYDIFRRTLPHLVAATGGVRRIDELLQIRSNIVDAPNVAELPPFQDEIRFNQVEFSYTGDQPHLDGVDLTIEAGQYVAFVGPSGAGKSTVLNLLMRFYDVGAGSVTVDGHDVRSVTQASLRSQMGVVMQETFLLNATIGENIRIVKPDASDDELVAAAKAAELHDFILSLPRGYDTNAGEAGGMLSGGQRQRIAIARAMLVDPAILILDEATASLDAEIAAAVHETIESIARTRTVISITHHLPFAMHADRIFVLDHGRLVEQGRHADLLATGGLYAQMWRTQTEMDNTSGEDSEEHP